MKPYQQSLYAKLGEFEGCTSWMILDTHKPPLVTVGEGCAISLIEALTLPWTLDGVPCTTSQIKLAYQRVAGMQGAMIAKAYKYQGCICLTDQACQDLVQKRFDTFDAELHMMFPEFDTYPLSAQTALGDLIYNLGEGRNGTHSTGLYGYPHLIAAVLARKWSVAALQSGVDVNVEAFKERNEWVASLFNQAAQEDVQG